MDFFQSNLSMEAIASSCTKNMGRGGKQSLAMMRTAMMKIILGTSILTRKIVMMMAAMEVTVMRMDWQPALEEWDWSTALEKNQIPSLMLKMNLFSQGHLTKMQTDMEQRTPGLSKTCCESLGSAKMMKTMLTECPLSNC